MARLKKRPFGREATSSRKGSFTHVIKIGFDGREINPKDRDGNPRKHPIPAKLPGFLICRDSVDPNTGNLLVDFAAMAKLGNYDQAAVTKAKKEQLKAPAGTLPDTLQFVMLQNAERDAEGTWQFPGLINESLEWWGKNGLACHGNGEVAERRLPNSAVSEIRACNPIGKIGITDQKDYCPQSVDRLCKPHARVSLCLYFEDQAGKPQPLDSRLGWSATYRIDTGSGYSPAAFLEMLDNAADWLSGNIAGIRGTLRFSVQKKRHAEGVGITQQLVFTLNVEDLRQRYADLQEAMLRRTDSSRALEARVERKQLGTDQPAAKPAAASDVPFKTTTEVEGAEEVDDAEYDPAADENEFADELPFEDPQPDRVPRAAVEEAMEANPFADDAPMDAIDQSTMDELKRSLDSYVKLLAKEEDASYESIMKRVARVEFAGRAAEPTTVSFFTAERDPRKAEIRANLLRDLCRGLLGDPRFTLYTSTRTQEVAS